MVRHMRIVCSECEKGTYEPTVLREFDAGRCIGLKHLVVREFPMLVCTRCGAWATLGTVTSRVAAAATAEMLRHETLTPEEARFLRQQTLDTQEEFAERLGVVRATVNRWETGVVVLGGASSRLVRMHVFLWLYEREPKMRDMLESLRGYFTDSEEEDESRPSFGILEGQLAAASL
jgi:transcriptional regulator with XRE-family HTH domain